jgi:hypothetical protein
MKHAKFALLISLAALVAGCGHPVPVEESKTRDYGFGAKHLSQLQAGVWIDPNGCDHWIIDDGVEGYLSQRLDKYGKPVCSGTAPPTVATGNFKGAGDISDPAS